MNIISIFAYKFDKLDKDVEIKHYDKCHYD